MSGALEQERAMRLELTVSRLLTAGVAVAASVTLLGGALLLWQHGAESLADFSLGRFHGEPAALCSVTGIIAAAASGSAHGIIQLGVLLLLATPILRVAFCLVAFAARRDRLYTVVTAVVLVVLLGSLFFKG